MRSGFGCAFFLLASDGIRGITDVSLADAAAWAVADVALVVAVVTVVEGSAAVETVLVAGLAAKVSRLLVILVDEVLKGGSLEMST